MAKASWAVVDPSQGSGNATINVSSNTHNTGRNVRRTILTISAAHVEDKTVSVIQHGKPAYVDVINNATAGKEGSVVTIKGEANSKKLTFSLGDGTLPIELPAQYTVGGENTTNGSEINGDPGASAAYDFSIVINVPKNESGSELKRQIIVEDESGNRDTCLLTQSADGATLTVSKDSIELDWTGEAVSFDITSNTSWTIS